MPSYKDDKIFCTIVDMVIASEGGYSDRPTDSGGPTMWGIAWNYNRQALEKKGYTRFIMAKLSREDAVQIYYEKYYLGSGAKGLTDEGLAYIHFDCAVNQGIGFAQKVLGSLSKNPFWFDGTGNKNSQIFLPLYLEYIVKRIDRYTELKKSLRTEYLTGWMNRIEHVFYGVSKVEELGFTENI